MRNVNRQWRTLACSGILALGILPGSLTAAEAPKKPEAGARNPAAATNKLKEGDFVAILGGSATAAKVYSVQLETYLVACRPAPGLRTMLFGSSSFGGSEDLQSACSSTTGPLPFQPTVATMYYIPPAGSPVPKEYQEQTKQIMDRCKAAGARFVAVAPGPVSPELQKAAKEAAAREGGVFADFAGVMTEVNTKARAKYGADYDVSAGQRAAGGLVITYAFLKALGCDGRIGTVTMDLAAGNATATAGHKVLSARDGEVEIESTRYPFCFTGDPKSPDATAGVIEFFPFNQDLNRFLLVVKGAKAARLKVTWGRESREFAAAALAKGINLAAEFPDNPFQEPLQKVMDKVRDKQLYESQLFEFIGNTNGTPRASTANAAPDAARNWEAMVALGVKCVKDRQDEVAEAVVPVKHVIKVEPLAAK